MSNFWATRLAPAAPAAPVYAPAPQQAAPAGPWWQNNALMGASTPQPPAQPQQAAQEPAQEPGQWGTVEGSKKKAKSSRMMGTCPDCDSGNYGKPPGQPNAMEQCYDCGYNPRFAQMSAQGGLPSEATGPTQAARQTGEGGGRGGVSNFNPGTIIAHI